jgi:endoglycosylceramidase
MLKNKQSLKLLMISFAIFFLSIYKINSKISINPLTKMFEDNSGRSLIFHGVNVVYKQAPYIPITDSFDPLLSLNDDDINYMKQMGFNIVRLGVIWESVEKTKGKYDLEYLKKMAEIVRLLGLKGIYTIIDAHQDMFSRLFCGEGVPIFYAKKINVDTKCDTNLIAIFFKFINVCLPLSKYNWEYEENGIPKIDFCRKNFLKYHQSPELTTAYHAFYENENGIQDKFIDFWRVVANEFKKNPYIIGLDYWNEPWPGNLFMSTYPLIPGYVDNYILAPFYRRLDEAVREFDHEFISLYEPVPFPDTLPFFGGISVGSFKEIPLNKTPRKYQALNMHSYCCMAKADACETGEPLLEDSLTLCADFHKRKLKKNKETANNLGVPLIITEFGACSNTQACFNEITSFANAADENLLSWAYWMYKPFNDHTTSARQDEEGIFRGDGTLDPFKEKALTRTYIQAYQGVPFLSKFDTDTGFYYTGFKFNSEISEPSKLYMNRNLFYKNFKENFTIRLFNENNEDIYYEILPMHDKCIDKEKEKNTSNNYFNTNKINYFDEKKNEFEKKISENYFNINIDKNISKELNGKNIYFSIVPNIYFNSDNFDKERKINYTIKNSSEKTNYLKVIDKEKYYKNVKIKIDIEFSINNNLKIDNIEINTDYKLSDVNVYIKKLTIYSDLGEIKIENLFGADIEVIME